MHPLRTLSLPSLRNPRRQRHPGRIPVTDKLGNLFSARNLTAMPIPTPADVAAPPASAKKTASGLASKVLKAGKGGNHPRVVDTVVVNYNGWTTRGKIMGRSRRGAFA
jgi:hypothetical protein